ncbi:MAG: hypothetical protein HQM16_10720 [Deltaproteobacteria bacterium]|nr:hypothetical protein [Deltaproteobacteria bacterium]
MATTIFQSATTAQQRAAIDRPIETEGRKVLVDWLGQLPEGERVEYATGIKTLTPQKFEELLTNLAMLGDKKLKHVPDELAGPSSGPVGRTDGSYTTYEIDKTVDGLVKEYVALYVNYDTGTESAQSVPDDQYRLLGTPCESFVAARDGFVHSQKERLRGAALALQQLPSSDQSRRKDSLEGDLIMLREDISRHEGVAYSGRRGGHGSVSIDDPEGLKILKAQEAKILKALSQIQRSRTEQIAARFAVADQALSTKGSITSPSLVCNEPAKGQAPDTILDPSRHMYVSERTVPYNSIRIRDRAETAVHTSEDNLANFSFILALPQPDGRVFVGRNSAEPNPDAPHGEPVRVLYPVDMGGKDFPSLLGSLRSHGFGEFLKASGMYTSVYRSLDAFMKKGPGAAYMKQGFSYDNETGEVS